MSKIKNSLPMIELKLSLINDNLDKLNEKIKEGIYKDRPIPLNWKINSIDKEINELRKEIREYQLIKILSKNKINYGERKSTKI